MSRLQIELDDAADRWRYRCPAGHSNFEAVNDHFWCQSCANSADPDHEPVFHDLLDTKTGEILQRDEVEITDYQDYLRHVGHGD